MNYTKIECSHELPEKEGMYFAFFKDKDDPQQNEFYDSIRFSGKFWQTFESTEFVTAWLKPLPEQTVDWKDLELAILGRLNEFTGGVEQAHSKPCVERIMKHIKQAVAQSQPVKLPKHDSSYSVENMLGFYRFKKDLIGLNPNVRFE